MPRPIMHGTSAATRSFAQDARQRTGPAASRTILRDRRSDAYLAALRRLDPDSKAHVSDLSDIIDTVRQEFEKKWAAMPSGLVARCYLGYPYRTHILSLDGRIVEHYESGQRLPGEFDRANSYAANDAYEFVEVYLDKLVCVRADGTTVTLEG